MPVRAAVSVDVMTTKERLYKLVDELTDVEAGQALQVIASRPEHAAQTELPSSIVLDEAQAQRFLVALDAPAGFEPGLRLWPGSRACSAGERVSRHGAARSQASQNHLRCAAVPSPWAAYFRYEPALGRQETLALLEEILAPDPHHWIRRTTVGGRRRTVSQSIDGYSTSRTP